MELHNASKLQATYTGALYKDGRHGIVIVAKGSWQIPDDVSQTPKLLATKQSLPIQETDTFTGEPGLSAPVWENDLATTKPVCDVIMHACAHAQNGAAEKQVRVGLKLNQINKQFIVTGSRQWQASTFGHSLTDPTPFRSQEVSYDLAFGGTDLTHQDEGKTQVCMTNPIGRGYLPDHPSKTLDGRPGPQTEEADTPVTSAHRKYVPQSFGPIARNWEPRIHYGGTYDQHWMENIRPFLPDDFDERFYQCAPPDQQTKYLEGGELVELTGVSPRGTVTFHIPENGIYMAVIDGDGQEHELSPKADTLMIEPEYNRFSIVWRADWPLRRSPEEVETILVGTPTKAWRRARMLGKVFLPYKGKKIA
ncbi:DUF2169 family type VI secretion system accessory protein [Vibrio quintilis]|uniref:DUF2169 domain-containing protein n=1 Tax=Vibrio quintilis TaxID=1117707 RepID=A0A1M7YW84_9VIBR|nr:DUF2169 domain-containing protein [Vibrio quintilis]SHO56848.1 hypothetical protein VQ7734_02617 [Vibrio quintilis]